MNKNGLKKLKEKIRPTKKILYWSIARKKTVIYCQIWQMISNKSIWTSALIHSSIWIVNQLIWFVIFDMSQSIFITYRTKCWKMYFKIEKLIGGNLLSKPRSANSRQLRSVFTSIFKFDGAPFRDKIDAGNWKQKKWINWEGNRIKGKQLRLRSLFSYLRFPLAPSSRPFQTKTVGALRRNLSEQLQRHLQECPALQCPHLVLLENWK